MAKFSRGRPRGYEDDRSEITKAIVRARARHEWLTASDMADRIGVSVSRLREIESGRAIPTHEEIGAIHRETDGGIRFGPMIRVKAKAIITDWIDRASKDQICYILDLIDSQDPNVEEA